MWWCRSVRHLWREWWEGQEAPLSPLIHQQPKLLNMFSHSYCVCVCVCVCVCGCVCECECVCVCWVYTLHVECVTHTVIRPVQINFLFPVHRLHPQAGSQCAWLLFTINIFNVRRDGPNCNCCLQTDCHPHYREKWPALQQYSILDSLQTQLLTTALCHYVHQRIKFLIPSPSWHDWGSHWPHLLRGQNRVLTI